MQILNHIVKKVNNMYVKVSLTSNTIALLQLRTFQISNQTYVNRMQKLNLGQPSQIQK